MPDALVRFDPEAVSKDSGDVVYMSPDQYLALSPPMKANPVKDAKGRELRESVESGDAIRQVPSLKISIEDGGKGKVMGQDGRHRAELAKEAGIELIPVKVDKTGKGEISSVVGMRGEEMPWDVKKPRKWGDVAGDAKFKAMPVDQQNAVRARFFDEVVAPTLPANARAPARGSWTEKWKSRATTGSEVPDPSEEMSGFERFRAGAGKAFKDTFYTGPGSAVGLIPGSAVAEERTRAEKLLATPGGNAGNLLGTATALAPAAFIPGANTVTGAGLIGAGIGALQPAASMGERGGNIAMSALTSSGLTAGMRTLPALKAAFIDPFLVSGQQRIALDQVMRFAKDKAALRGQIKDLEILPGSKGSLAEVTGDPGIAQLQRAAQAKSPEVASAFADARVTRMKARMDAVEKVKGSEGEREFFEAARDATAERLYKKAFDTPIKPKALTPAVQGEITELMDRPSMKEAVKRSFALAREEGLTLNEGEGDYVRRLHYTKKALDEQIEAAAQQPSLQRALMGTKDKLIAVLDKVSPKYAEARAQYQADSKPINRMEVGDYLSKKLFPALNEYGTERYRPESFAKALQDGDAMAKKATGFKGAKLGDILTTDQTETLIKLAKDVAREAAAAERAKVGGSPTAQYLAGSNVLRQLAGPLGLPESWVEATAGKTLAHWINVPAKHADERIGVQLGKFLTDPDAARSAYAAAEKRRLAGPTIMGEKIPLSRLGEVLVPGAALPSGAYATQQ